VKIILSSIIMLMVTCAASAAIENITTGPYVISFNMNTTANYSIQHVQSSDTPIASTYPISIKTNNSTQALVSIVEYKNATDSTLAMDKNVVGLSTANIGYFLNISFVDVIIDNKKGFIVTGVNPKGERMFRAYYWLDSKDCECGPVSVGKTEIGVMSTYSWNITKNILSSLNVSRSKQSVKPKTMIFGPPKSI